MSFGEISKKNLNFVGLMIDEPKYDIWTREWFYVNPMNMMYLVLQNETTHKILRTVLENSLISEAHPSQLRI